MKNITFKFDVFILIFIYAIIAPILEYFFPIKIFGFSFFFIIIQYIFLLFLLIRYINKFRYKYYFVFFILFLIFIIIFRNIFYLHPLDDFFKTLYIFTIPILLSSFYNYKISYKSRKLVTNLIYFILFFNFLNSIFKMAGFIHLELTNFNSYDYIDDNRFGGLYGNSNGLGNYTILYLSYLFLIFPIKNYMYSILFFLITFFTILPTLSRGAFLGVFILSFYFFLLYNFKFKRLFFISITFILIYFLAINSNLYKNIDPYISVITNRFVDQEEINDNGRTARNIYAFKKTSSSFLAIGIGIPKNDLVIDKYSDVSDNSFTLVFTSFGFIFLFLYLILITFSSNINRHNLVRKFLFLFLLLIIFYNNNALLWGQFCITASLGFILLNNKSKYNIK